MQEWQDIWNCCDGNKLHYVYPEVGNILQNKSHNTVRLEIHQNFYTEAIIIIFLLLFSLLLCLIYVIAVVSKSIVNT